MSVQTLRRLICVFVCAFVTLLTTAMAQAQTGNSVPKVALLIGNASYQQDRYSLKNPVNDIDLMAQSLQKLGFAVTKHTNLRRSEMLRAVTDFASAVPAGATTFVYYAGHGMQIGGESYLIPTDMPLTSEQAVALRAVPLATVLEKVSRAHSSVNVVVLDACRNNPYQPMSSVRYRGATGLGLAQVKAPRGTLVAYSTSPNQQAPDGTGSNSPYAKALANSLLQPGQSLIGIFSRVGEQVRKSTYDDQIPWFASSLADDYFFLPSVGVSVVAGKGLIRQPEGTEIGAKGRSLAGAAAENPWYAGLSDQEWSELDWEIQQRVKRLTADELPGLEHKAAAGNVVAQTTLGLAWREGIHKSVTPQNAQVTRYGANTSKAVQWLQRAANAGFAVAQVELGEMYYTGHGVLRNIDKAKALFEKTSGTRYPRARLGLAQLGLESGDGPEGLIDAFTSVLKAQQPTSQSKAPRPMN